MEARRQDQRARAFRFSARPQLRPQDSSGVNLSIRPAPVRRVSEGRKDGPAQQPAPGVPETEADMDMQTMAEDKTFAAARPLSRSTSGLWAGRVMSGLAVLFLLFDSVGKLLQVKPVIDGTIELGYPVSTVLGLGVTLLICVIAYVIPRTSVLGAVLLTGYLGGAIATHVRVQNPLFTHVLFPIYVAMFIWGGLVLRDVRLRAFLPWRSRS